MQKPGKIPLGGRLKILRQQFFEGSLKDLSIKMEGLYSPSGISRRESGLLKVNWQYLEHFCKAVELPENEKLSLLASIELSVFASQKDYLRHADAFNRLMEGAALIQNHTLVIPAYLQTLRYTQAIFRNHHQSEKFNDIAQKRRQHLESLIFSPSRRIMLTFPESSLYIPIGSAEAMEEQLKKLIATQVTDNFEFRVLPINVFVNVPTHYFFTIVDKQYAMSENRLKTASENDPTQIQRLQEDFEVIWAAAAQGEKLRSTLERALAHYQAML